MTTRQQIVAADLHPQFSSRTFALYLVLLFSVNSACLLALAPIIAAPPESAQEQEEEQKAENEADSLKSKAQMAAMKRIAAGLKVTTSDEAQRDAEVIPEALFRSHDPARENSPDGSIWGYGRKGRPVALLSLALYPPVNGKPGGWLHELNSLSTDRVEGTISGQRAWSTRKSGLDFKPIPGAPAAAEKEAGRTRQLRELSARFTGFESLHSKGLNAPAERFQLRLIPRPIYRYSDPDRGQIDGAIFLMTYSTNPEIVMVIELVREEDKTVWKYGFNRIAFAELHVEFDGKEVWTQPHLQGTGASETYWLFFKPLASGELDPE